MQNKCRFVFFSRLEIDYNIMVYNTSGVVVDCCFYKITLFRMLMIARHSWPRVDLYGGNPRVLGPTLSPNLLDFIIKISHF